MTRQEPTYSLPLVRLPHSFSPLECDMYLDGRSRGYEGRCEVTKFRGLLQTFPGLISGETRRSAVWRVSKYYLRVLFLPHRKHTTLSLQSRTRWCSLLKYSLYYSEKHVKQTKTQCGKTQSLFNIQAGGTYRHRGLPHINYDARIRLHRLSSKYFYLYGPVSKKMYELFVAPQLFLSMGFGLRFNVG